MAATKESGIVVVSADSERAERVAGALRNNGQDVTIESQGPRAAGQVGSVQGGVGMLVIDLELPELDQQRLREALGESGGVPDSLEVVEKRQIAAMLRYTSGNRRKAAQLLGLARSTLLAKIRRYDLESPAAASEV